MSTNNYVNGQTANAQVNLRNMKTLENLFRFALIHYDMSEDKVRAFLKEKGFVGFNSKRYFEYLDALRWDWLEKVHIVNATPVPDRQAEERRLLELERTLVMDCSDLSCWKWSGSEEALAAHWQLENMRREQNKKKMYPFRRV